MSGGHSAHEYGIKQDYVIVSDSLTMRENDNRMSLSVFFSSLCSFAKSVEEVDTDAGRHRLCW